MTQHQTSNSGTRYEQTRFVFVERLTEGQSKDSRGTGPCVASLAALTHSRPLQRRAEMYTAEGEGTGMTPPGRPVTRCTTKATISLISAPKTGVMEAREEYPGGRAGPACWGAKILKKSCATGRKCECVYEVRSSSPLSQSRALLARVVDQSDLVTVCTGKEGLDAEFDTCSDLRQTLQQGTAGRVSLMGAGSVRLMRLLKLLKKANDCPKMPRDQPSDAVVLGGDEALRSKQGVAITSSRAQQAPQFLSLWKSPLKKKNPVRPTRENLCAGRREVEVERTGATGADHWEAPTAAVANTTAQQRQHVHVSPSSSGHLNIRTASCQTASETASPAGVASSAHLASVLQQPSSSQLSPASHLLSNWSVHPTVVMPRPKKQVVDDKAKQAAQALLPVSFGQTSVLPNQQQMQQQNIAPPPALPQRVVDIDSFLRVRDSAVGRLTTILELLRSFTADYVRQTSLLMGEPTPDGPQDNLLANFENAAAQLIMPLPDVAPPVEEKKERKKRTHDPNAPKRPLTPYFLYMQHARSIIANDLGTEAPKGAVQEEGQRRWAHMGPMEKQGWNNAYQYNLRLYNARVHSYKNGNPMAKSMSDEEALKYAEDYHIPMPELKEIAHPEPSNDHDAIAEQLQQVAAAPVLPEFDEDEFPAKTPKKATGGRKRKPATPAVEYDNKTLPISPAQKRRRTSTKAAEPQEEPKKSGRKKAKSS
ncbi:hypothetical protein G7046_g9392 [Stylonectria norvegica]|nr:hypothetical protein G7046_g9392 [Stylonectria norvegica]